jgi:hypothetical protein
MKMQKFCDAGVHPETIRNARAASVPTEPVVELTNHFLAAVVAGHADFCARLFHLLNGFHAAPSSQRVTAMPGPDQTLKHLLDAGIDGDLMVKANLPEGTILTWLTSLLSLATQWGPSVLVVITDLLSLIFKPPAPVPVRPPNPTPTMAPPAPHAGLWSAPQRRHFTGQSQSYSAPIKDATDELPIIVSVAAPHNLQTNDMVVIEGVMGNTGANGAWKIEVLDPTRFTLIGAVHSGPYKGGGTYYKVQNP